MSESLESLESIVDGGATFMEVVEHLSREFSPLRPIDLLQILQERLGIPFTVSRNVLEYFNPQLDPLVDVALINERGQDVLSRRLR